MPTDASGDRVVSPMGCRDQAVLLVQYPALAAQWLPALRPSSLVVKVANLRLPFVSWQLLGSCTPASAGP